MTNSLQSINAHLRHDVILRGGLLAAVSALVAIVLMATIVWLFLINRLETRVENSLIQRHEISLSNASDLTDEDRNVIRRFRKNLPVRDEGVFSWIDNTGKMFSGSVVGLDCRGGFYDHWLDITRSADTGPLQIVARDEIDPKRHDRFRFLGNSRDEGCVIFGRSMYEVDATKESVLGLLVWLIPLCILPAVGVGLRQSLNLRKRLIGVGDVVHSVSRGYFGSRIEVRGDDDIDRLALSANRSFDRLQESVNTLQQLTAVVAHDLRSPLNKVAIPLDEALRASEAGESTTDSLHQVKEGLRDVQDIFDALLRISQIESGRRRSQFSAIDFHELTSEMFEIYQPVVEDAGKVLEYELVGDGKSIISGDADLLKQALVNLIDNAIRYTPDGSTINICSVRDQSSPKICVIDNGAGLPVEERPRVLERLYRYHGGVNSAENVSGHGLGLALVKAVADLHDAEISVDDAQPGLLVRLTFHV